MKWVYLLIIVCINAELLGQSDYEEGIVKFRFEKEKEHIADRRAPLSENDFSKVHYFKPNKKYFCPAKIILFELPDTIKIPTSSGKLKKFLRAGELQFTLKGKPQKLIAFLSTREDVAEYFIPFTDKTNGKSSYGGGRYIEILLEDCRENKTVLDFNKAYNPWCAYSDGFNCPIPPPENYLALSIKAGEKIYTGDRKAGSKSKAN